MAAIEIPAERAAAGLVLTVKITGLLRYRMKLWIARQLIKFAASIISVGLEFEEGGDA
jgi:hypothetical protein